MASLVAITVTAYTPSGTSEDTTTSAIAVSPMLAEGTKFSRVIVPVAGDGVTEIAIATILLSRSEALTA